MALERIRRAGRYAPLSATYYQDDAIAEAGEAAELLFLRGLAFCAQRNDDGFISATQLRRFVGVGMSDTAERARALVAVGLWLDVDGGYQVRSWLTWNKSAAEIDDYRRRDRHRKTTPPPAAGSAPASTAEPAEPTSDAATSTDLSPAGIRAGSARNPTHNAVHVSAVHDSALQGRAVRDPAPPPPPHTPGATPRGTRIPADFAPTPDMIAWAQTHTPGIGAAETAKFVDYWTGEAGPKALKADWQAAWRKWMRSAHEHHAPHPRSTRQVSPTVDYAGMQLLPRTVEDLERVQRFAALDPTGPLSALTAAAPSLPAITGSLT